MNAPFILSDDDATRSMPSMKTMRGRTTPRGERLRAGDVLLGRYTVLSELGEGGMGVVYKCLDKVGGIEVALKCLPPELSRNEAEMEGIRENYAIVAKLHHSAISGLRNLERDPDFGEYYLVMDLAEGEDLSALLRRRHGAPMPPAEAIAILRPLASALDYAHGETVIHRDIKPGNVKVIWGGAARPGEPHGPAAAARSESSPHRFRVQLLDFGLAAEVRSSLSRVSRKGYLGSSGTPAYMAPEQWEARPQGPAADQYALAVVAYEMLAGVRPFDADDPDLLRRAVLTRAPDPIPSLPRRANAALLRALAKDPAARFPTCTAFVDALAKGRDASKTHPLRRAGLLGAGLLGAGLLGAALLFPGGAGRPSEPPSQPSSISSSALVPSLPPEGARLEELQAARGRLADGLALQKDAKAEQKKIAAVRPAARESGNPASRNFGTSMEPIRIDLGGGVTLEMVHCPGVSPDFWMGKFEVTQEQWERVMGNNPSYFKGAKRPVEQVSAHDCIDFVGKLNELPSVAASGLTFRLPMEDEWNTACRAGSPESEDYCMLADGTQIQPPILARVANFGKRRDDGSANVGGLMPNAWNLYDVHGNVWEWTRSRSGDAWFTCGGCWDSSASYCGASVLESLSPEEEDLHLGLRLAADMDNSNDSNVNGSGKGLMSLKGEKDGPQCPRLSIAAVLPDGTKPICAQLRLGEKEYLLPVTLKIHDSIPYGPGEIAFEKDGVSYFGILEKGVVDWQGVKRIVVRLSNMNPETETNTDVWQLQRTVKDAGSSEEAKAIPGDDLCWPPKIPNAEASLQEFFVAEMLFGIYLDSLSKMFTDKHPDVIAASNGMARIRERLEDFHKDITNEHEVVEAAIPAIFRKLEMLRQYAYDNSEKLVQLGLGEQHPDVLYWRHIIGSCNEVSELIENTRSNVRGHHSVCFGEQPGERCVVNIGSHVLALRWCPPGSFLMGDPAEEGVRFFSASSHTNRLHRVTLTKGFYMGETEVTQRLWKKVMGFNPSYFKSGDNFPVGNVSWNDCHEFLRKLNANSPQGWRFALPTAAQWEYACRAGTDRFHGSNENVDQVAWHVGNSSGEPAAVGTKKPNAWGFYDMIGNVSEWCGDWYGTNSDTAVIEDPTGPSSGTHRVLRGGSVWYQQWTGGLPPDSHDFTAGVRVALVPVQ